MRAFLTGLVATGCIVVAVLVASSWQPSPLRDPTVSDGMGHLVASRVLAALAAERERQAERQQALAYAAAVVAAVPDWSADWDGVAGCETGGNWQHVGYSPAGDRYDGGLGILHGAWVQFGGREFAPFGEQASRVQQMRVAERIYARHGLSGWGCKSYG